MYAQNNGGYNNPYGGTIKEVSADKNNQELLDMIQNMEWFVKAIYLILRPLLAIAGASLDNSLVYGEIFFLDTMLRRFWQIMRNFVNFAI